MDESYLLPNEAENKHRRKDGNTIAAAAARDRLTVEAVDHSYFQDNDEAVDHSYLQANDEVELQRMDG